MEQSSEESLESENSEKHFYEGNDYFKVSKAKTFPTPSGDMKISDHNIQGESAKDENSFALRRAKLQEVKEFKNANRKERGRAKSVSRDVSKSFKTSSENTKRAVSMPRSEQMTKRASPEKSESPEREKELTFFSKMSDKERKRLIREKLGLKPKVSFQDKQEDKNSDYKQRRKSRSRSRSREMDCHRSRKRGREETKERRSHGDQTYSKRSRECLLSKDQRCYGDQSRAQKMEQKGLNHFRDHGHVERKKEIPCKYFNDAGFCKYSSGHPDLFGNRKLHICMACYYERGEKRLHSQVDCPWEKRHHSQVDCPVVDEACMYFNNFGDCEYKSGHLSLDGKYARHHICKVCFESGEKSFHSAIHCKHKVKKFRKDSPITERYQSRHDSKYHDEGGHRRNYSKTHDEDRRNDSKHHDEKPCNFFNNNGSCKFASGHFPGSGGFTKQLHICSCCLEFLGAARDHPASNCSLKKKLSGGRIHLVSDEVTELPCNSFNSGNCVLKSGHRLSGVTRFLHICKFCFEYRGEQNYHTQEECKLKRKLLQEVRYESQSRNDQKETRDEKPENKITRKIKERSPTGFKEKSRKHLRGDRLSVNVTHQDEKIVDWEDSRQLKTANELKVSLIKSKTSQVAEKSAKATSCQQPKHMEEAINQTKSYIEEDKHETFLKMKDPNKEEHDFGDTNLEKKDYDETDKETSTESDEEKGKYSNQTKTVLKDKEKVYINDQGKVHNPHLLEINPFYHSVKSKSNKEESGKKRRKLERCTPQAVINFTDSSETGVNIGEINEKKENSCEEGLLPVDDVLKDSNGQIGKVESELEMNEREIMKKIKHLEELHTIEVEKLRKARYQTAEVTGCAQELP